ncbi:hypothetical protein HYW60_00770 [Candidatus Kaiserbacteria bacterium]|nr:hypothetical protein [Candidatus Kaiserbacteria bacterium]
MDPQKAAEIAKDPRKTEDVLNVIAKGRSGDAQSAEAIASNVPELNREDVKKLSDIDPEKIPPATVASVKEMTQAVPDTFERGGTTQAAPPDSAAQEDAFYGYDSSYYPTGYPYASPSYQRGGPFANSNLFSSLFSLLRNLFSRRSSESPASPRPSPSPEASIVVRPQEVTRGNPIFVSWSSVGMSVLSPCQVSLSRGGASTILARGNAGSRAISTHATTTPGVWNFTLECTRPSGTLLKRETSAVVK